MLRRCALFLIGFAVALPAFAQTGWITLTNSVPLTYLDGTGDTISNAQACFEITNLAGQQIGVHVGVANGHAAGGQICTTVTSGTIAPVELPDTNLSAPQNACIQLTIASSVATGGDGSTILGGPGSGYACMQPAYSNTWCTSGSCDLSKYVPTTTPGVLQTTGATGPPSTITIGSVTTLAPGSPATFSLSGLAPNYTASIGLPAGSGGVAANAAGGANQIQYYCGSGSFCADSSFTYNPATHALGVASVNLNALADLYDLGSSDCSAKVTAAFADTTVPTIYAGPNCGNFQSALTVPSDRTLVIENPGATQTVCGVITVAPAATLEGLPMASDGGPMTLQEAAGCNLSTMISLQGHAVLRNLRLDGNKANNATAQDAVLVNNANRVHILDATILGAQRDDLHVTSTMYPTVTASEALTGGTIVTLSVTQGGLELWQVTTAGTGASGLPSCAKGTVGSTTCPWGSVVFTDYGPTLDDASGDGYLGPDVELETAGRDCMFMERQADWIIGTQVEFEGCARDGAHLEDSATNRFSDVDFGGSTSHGLSVQVVNAPATTGEPSSGNIVTGSQFGNNLGGDIYEIGSAYYANSGNTSAAEFAGAMQITGNSFIGNHAANCTLGGTITGCADAIQLVDTGGDNIAGNAFGFIQPSWVAPYKYIVEHTYAAITQQYPVTVFVNNLLQGTWANASPFSLLPADAALNMEGSNGLQLRTGTLTINGGLSVTGTLNAQGDLNVTGGLNANGVAAGAYVVLNNDAGLIFNDSGGTHKYLFTLDGSNNIQVGDYFGNLPATDHLKIVAPGGGTAIDVTNGAACLTNGYTGTKTAGSCVLTITCGTITAVSGC
jgi:hypothetical protein